MTALARITDPITSHEAAQVARKSTAREDVLRILREHGPLHDRGIEILHDAYVEKGLMVAKSPQRLRTARADLVDDRLVWEVEDGTRVRMPSGYTATIWEATDA